MSVKKQSWQILIVLLLTVGTTLYAGIKIDPGKMSPYSKTRVGANLYTPANYSASGGMRATLTDLPSELLGVLVMPQKFGEVTALRGADGKLSATNARSVNTHMIQEVYLARLTSENSFTISGLPPGKYDLFILCENCFYEGILLSRDDNTLTESDIASIKAKITESNPFFNLKNQHRIIGYTGRHGKARVVEQEVRTLPVTLQSAEVLSHIQIRSLKLCFMESVGGGSLGTQWEMKKTREITRQEVGPPDTKGLLPGYFHKDLQGIRISTRVRDLGEISLSASSVKGSGQSE